MPKSTTIDRSPSTITVTLTDRVDNLFYVIIASDRDGFDAESQRIARSFAMSKRCVIRVRDAYPIDPNGRTEMMYAFRRQSDAEVFYKRAIEICKTAQLIKPNSNNSEQLQLVSV